MEHSPAPRQRGLSAVLAAADLVGHLTLPLSLLSLTRGHVDAAAAGSVAAAVVSGARALVTGRAVEQAMRASWRRIAEAARGQSLADLRVRREDEESVATLLEAVREAALYDAVLVPQLAAKAVALACAIVAVAVVLGPGWLLLGAAALLPIGAFVVLGNARLRRAQQRAWKAFGEIGLDLRVLVEASAELRAHEREEPFARVLVARADAMARAERIVSRWSALSGLLPACLALVAVVAPLRAGVAWVASAAVGPKVAELGILGATAAVLALGVARSAEAAVRSSVHRRAVAEFLARGARSRPARSDAPGACVPVPPLAHCPIRFDRVAYVYPGARAATPAGVSFVWPERRGLALHGPNGAGKTTLALLLLGLLEPTSGAITLDGVSLGLVDGRALRRRVAYVPQSGFVAPGCSVAWHLRLLAGDSVTDASIDGALERVGLLGILEEHAARRGCAARDVPVGELSGGERQRMHVARTLLGDPELVVLDEPEAGIDGRGRELLRALLQELAKSKRVLLVAHDDSVVPASFLRLDCGANGHAAVRSHGIEGSLSGGEL